MKPTNRELNQVKSPRKLYPEHDPAQLDRDGNYYTRHVSAMTTEGLHDKSDIAEQLGWRDREIDQLKREVSQLRALLTEAAEEDVGQYVLGGEWHEAVAALTKEPT